MKDKIKIEPVIGEMLSVAQKVFESFNIDFYLVGAVARDIQFSASPELASLLYFQAGLLILPPSQLNYFINMQLNSIYYPSEELKMMLTK